jgi:hypothetical protein
MVNTRTRDVHWRLDPAVVRRLEELAYASGVSTSFAANYLLGNAVRSEAPEDQKVIPVENKD